MKSLRYRTAKVLCSTALLTGVITPAFAQQIKPLDVYQDPHGIDLVSNNVSTSKSPEISIPAAPELAFKDFADFIPLIEVKIGSGEPGFEPEVYRVSAGGAASDAFANCTVTTCYSAKGTGSRLMLGGDETSPGAGFGSYQYTQGGTGKSIWFQLETEIYDQTIPQPVRKYLAYEIHNPGGRNLSFQYESAFVDNATRHRPVVVTSTAGYELRFTYWSNAEDLNWGILKKVEIVASANPAVALASLQFQGNTVTDIAGRVFECVCMPSIFPEGPPLQKGSRLKLPGEAGYAFETTRQQNSNTRTVTSDGVTYSYVSVPDTGWANTQDAIHQLTITGPEGFYQFVDVTNTPSTTGEFDPPRRRIDSMTDALGRTTQYQYSATQRLRKVIYPEGNAAEVDYDTIGNLVSKRAIAKPASGQPDLVETAYHPSSGACMFVAFDCYRPQSIADARGNQTSFTWSADHGGMLTQLDPADAQGRRRKVKNTWSGAGPIAGETCGAAGAGGAPLCAPRLLQEEVCEADANGVELTCGTASAFVRSFTYFGATSLPLTETVTSGGQSLTTTYTYDAAGRVLSKDPPRTGVDDAAHYRYDNLGRRTWEIAPADANGVRLATRTTYRAADDKPVKVESGSIASLGDTNLTLFSQIETAYDARRLPTTSKLVAGTATYSLTHTSYDALNRPKCTAVRMTPAAYGSLPPSACTLGAEGSYGPDRITTNLYDAAGQLVQVREGVGTGVEAVEATWSYTANGRKAQVIDAGGNRAELRYDGFDRQARWVFPSAAGPSAYDDFSPANALASAGALNENDYEEYGYDANGNRTSLRKRDGSVLSYGYDALNRLTLKTVPERGGLAPTHTRDVHYGYDLRGLQTYARFDSASGEGVTTAYDGFGRKVSETLLMDGVSRAIGSSWDANGNRTQVTFPDGGWVSYGYDALGRNTLVSDWGGAALAWTNYDARGLPDNRSFGWGTNGIVAWQYDPAGRLAYHANSVAAGTTSKDLSIGYTYNPAGQVTSEERSNDDYSWTGHVNADEGYASNGLNQYTAAGTDPIVHNANGNLQSDGTHYYTYDIENRLVDKSGLASLRYDPLGRLYEVTGSTGTTRFLHDGDALAAEYDTAGALLRRHVHGAAAGVDDPLVTYEGAGSANRRWLYADRQGSIFAVTDGTVRLAANTYDEYGVPGSGNAGRFQYTGQVWLPEVGLNYYKARMYSPALGRFMQTDPVGYEDQINLYAYVGNDPINGVDPTGKFECVDNGDRSATCTANDPVDAALMAVYVSLVEVGILPHPADQSPSDDPASSPESSERIVPTADGTTTSEDNGGPPLDPPPEKPIIAPPVRPIEPPIDRQFNGRPASNQAQNQQVRDAARAEGLNAQQRRELGRAVEAESRRHGGNPGWREIREIAREIKTGRY